MALVEVMTEPCSTAKFSGTQGEPASPYRVCSEAITVFEKEPSGWSC